MSERQREPLVPGIGPSLSTSQDQWWAADRERHGEETCCLLILLKASRVEDQPSPPLLFSSLSLDTTHR
jgi:hypothetical protein